MVKHDRTLILTLDLPASRRLTAFEREFLADAAHLFANAKTTDQLGVIGCALVQDFHRFVATRDTDQLFARLRTGMNPKR